MRKNPGLRVPHGIRCVAALLIAVAVADVAIAQVNSLEKVVVPLPAAFGSQPDRDVSLPACCQRIASDDGRFLVFASAANNLVAGDSNQRMDVFVRDTQTGSVTRISSGPGGIAANGDSRNASISADGRFVAFESTASNLVAGDGNGFRDVFRFDRQTETMLRISSASGGGDGNEVSAAPSISADGNRIAFQSRAGNLAPFDSNGSDDIYLRDVLAGTTQCISVDSGGVNAAGFSDEASISADGQRVAFSSQSFNLVAGDSNNVRDIFVRDLVAATTLRASRATGGSEGNAASMMPALSADGTHVAFASLASNLAPGDGNGVQDVFRHRLADATTVLVSQRADGQSGDHPALAPTISANGRWVAFSSRATNLPEAPNNGRRHIFVRDVDVASTVLASRNGLGMAADDDNDRPVLSGTGSAVLFESNARNLVPGDANLAVDLMQRDLALATTARVAVADVSGPFAADTLATSSTAGTSRMLSDDGRFVYFSSQEPGLVAGDDNGTTDAFVRDRQSGTNILVSTTPGGTSGNAASNPLGLSADGRYALFATRATNILPGVNGATDEFMIRDLVAGTTVLLPAARSGITRVGFPMRAVLSGDGRHLAFSVRAVTGVLPDDGFEDVVVWHRDSDSFEFASFDTGGQAANADVAVHGLSFDGSSVLMSSAASDLVAGDSNGLQDVFVRDLVGGSTERVSVNSSGTQETAGFGSAIGSISDDARFVTFNTRAPSWPEFAPNGMVQAFLRDRTAATTTLVSKSSLGVIGNGGTNQARVSGNGRYVVMESGSTNLFPGDTSALNDVYVHDRLNGSMRRASLDSGGREGVFGNSGNGTVSGDGRYVLFQSNAGGWLLEAGYSERGIFAAYLADMGATLESSNAVTLSATPDPSGTGMPVVIEVRVAGASTAPVDGRVTVLASTGESCADNTPLADGVNAVRFTCTIIFATPGARSLSASYGNSSTHQSAATMPEPHTVVAFDYGDAPASYGTLFADNGARHGVTGPWLGSIATDAEAEALTAASGLGDDTTTRDDEDALAFGRIFDRGQSTPLVLVSSGPAFLDGFVDWNRDGDFDLPAEQFATSVPLTTGNNAVPFSVPLDAGIGATYLRLRISSSGGLGPDGFSADGEVEDHPVTLRGAPPSVSEPSSQVISEDASVAALMITIDDNETPAANLVLSATSDNQALISNAALAAGLSGTGSLSLMPAANANSAQFGVATITLTLTDADGQTDTASFGLTVNAINDRPTLALAGALNYPGGSVGVQSVPAFVTAVSAGPTADETATQQIVQYAVSEVSDPAGAVVAASLALDGTLSLTLSGLSGSAELQVIATDNGGSDDGGAPDSLPVSFFVHVASGADLQVAKSNLVGRVVAGQLTTWHILAGNAGPDHIGAARRVDAQPALLATMEWTCTPVQIAVCPQAGGSGAIDLDLNLPVNGILEFTVQGRVADQPGQTLTNTVSIAGPMGSTELQPSDNAASDSDPIVIDALFDDGFEDLPPRLHIPLLAP